jgi:hypothetical protein
MEKRRGLNVSRFIVKFRVCIGGSVLTARNVKASTAASMKAGASAVVFSVKCETVRQDPGIDPSGTVMQQVTGL